MTLLYQIALNQLPWIKKSHYLTLLKYSADLSYYFQNTHQHWPEIPFKKRLQDELHNLNWEFVEKTLHWSESADHYILTLTDPNYPFLLKEIIDPPPLIYAEGTRFDILSQLGLAMVGARKPTPIGLENAFQFAKNIAERRIPVISGMALGIDGACHRGALSTTFGSTIAVFGTGLQCPYPKSHLQLASRIAEQGLLLSEFPLNTPPKTINFPQRNRIISGLSLGTFVIEASLRSGSLITARLANEQGRDIFTLPGSIHNPLSQGCHHLIKQGAKLVESVADIFEEIALWQKFFTPEDKDKNKKFEPNNKLGITALGLTPLETKVFSAIDDAMTQFATIQQRCQLSLTETELRMILLQLEIKELIKSSFGRYCRLVGNVCNNA